MAVYISALGLGLGDLVVCLPAIQALIESPEKTYLVARTPRHAGLAACIPGLCGVIDEPAFLMRPLQEGDRYINLRDHPLQTDFRWDTSEFAERYPGFKIIEILEGICGDFGIKADFHRLKPLPFRSCPEAQGKVLFVPGSAQDSKCWGVSAWLELAERLAAQQGLESLVVGEPEKSAPVRNCLASGLEHLPTATISDALGALSSACLVVSVDTGLMHLALHQGTATVALYQHDPVYLRRSPLCFPLTAPPCADACRLKALEKKLNLDVEYADFPEPDVWDCVLPEGSRCLNKITADQVFAEAVRALTCKEKLEREPQLSC